MPGLGSEIALRLEVVLAEKTVAETKDTELSQILDYTVDTELKSKMEVSVAAKRCKPISRELELSLRMFQKSGLSIWKLQLRNIGLDPKAGNTSPGMRRKHLGSTACF